MSEQSLLYSLIAKDKIILVEHALFHGNFSIIAKECLQKVPSNMNKFTCFFPGQTFNFLMDNGFAFLVAANEAIGMRMPFVFLERVKDDFMKCYGTCISAMDPHSVLDPRLFVDFGVRLMEHMQHTMKLVEEADSIEKPPVAISELKDGVVGSESLSREELMEDFSLAVESRTMGIVGEDQMRGRESTVLGGGSSPVPFVGMEFESVESAYEFYNAYAKYSGFGIKKKSSSCSKRTKGLIHVVFACAKEGFKVKKENILSPRVETREGCMARMSIKKRRDSEKWVVTQVIIDHTHRLNPSEARFYRSHKLIIENGKKRKMIISRRRKIKTSKGMDVFNVEEIMEESVSEDEEDENDKEPAPVEGDGSLVPSVGMEFESVKAAHLFYNTHAKQTGFGTKKKSTSCRRGTKELIHVVFACAKEGYKKKDESTKHPRPDTREGCMAKMSIKKRMECEQWVVTQVSTDHTHPLNPSEAHLHRSHKPIKPKKKRRVILSRKKVVQPVMEMKSSDIEVKKESRCSFDQQMCLSLAEGGTQTILKHLTHMRAKNPAFFYAMDVDKDGHLRNVLWADSKCRMDYNYFADAVTFDTTYLKNKYNVPIVTFVGINHHGKSVLLGCGLAANETKETYVWLFNTWLAAMSGHPPVSIITDYCKSIQAAVAEVFPGVCHRVCLKHIVKEVPKKLDQLRGNEEFMKKLLNCIYDSLRIQEFEEKWVELIETYKLADNEWLETLYTDRQQWMPAYLTNTLFLEMSTSPQNDDIHDFFNGYLHPETTVKEFFYQYELALQNQYEKEVRSDFDSCRGKPVLKTKSIFESQAATFYSREIFSKFQDEISAMPNCSTRHIKEDGPIVTYMVKEREQCDDGTIVPKGYGVTFEASKREVHCTCRSFESGGILCRHALSVLVDADVTSIPSQYMLTRWRKDTKSNHILDEDQNRLKSGSWTERYNDLCHRSIQLAEYGALGLRTYEIALDTLQEAISKVHLTDDSLSSLPQPSTMSCSSQADNTVSVGTMLYPQKIRAIDRRRAKRLRSTVDNSAAKLNTKSCSICKKPGHTKTTCKEGQVSPTDSSVPHQVGTQEGFYQTVLEGPFDPVTRVLLVNVESGSSNN